jgi:hypothetical protein
VPYGIAKDAGGDSLENVAKMERCVKSVMAEGASKSSAIAICKSSIQDSARGKRKRGRRRSAD